MQSILDEYGGMSVIIITIVVFFYILNMLTGEGSGYSIENTYSADVVDIDYNNDVVWDATSGKSFILSPHFKTSEVDVNLLDVTTYHGMKSFKMKTDKFTKADAMKIVKAYADEANKVPIKDSEVVVLVTRYDVETTNIGSNGKVLENPQPLYEEVDAVDEYGHVIPGQKVKQVLYKDGADNDGVPGDFLGALGDDFAAINITQADKDLPIMPHFKLVYRVGYPHTYPNPSKNEYPYKKAEFVTFLVKESENVWNKH